MRICDSCKVPIRQGFVIGQNLFCTQIEDNDRLCKTSWKKLNRKPSRMKIVRSPQGNCLVD